MDSIAADAQPHRSSDDIWKVSIQAADSSRMSEARIPQDWDPDGKEPLPCGDSWGPDVPFRLIVPGSGLEITRNALGYFEVWKSANATAENLGHQPTSIKEYQVRSLLVSQMASFGSLPKGFYAKAWHVAHL